jgi:hypothetical protein
MRELRAARLLKDGFQPPCGVNLDMAWTGWADSGNTAWGAAVHELRNLGKRRNVHVRSVVAEIRKTRGREMNGQQANSEMRTVLRAKREQLERILLMNRALPTASVVFGPPGASLLSLSLLAEFGGRW